MEPPPLPQPQSPEERGRGQAAAEQEQDQERQQAKEPSTFDSRSISLAQIAGEGTQSPASLESSLGDPAPVPTWESLVAAEEYRRRHQITVATATGQRSVPPPVTSFRHAGLPEHTRRQMEVRGYDAPTPVQAQAWPWPCPAATW